MGSSDTDGSGRSMGAWGGLARRLADAGVNIDFHYLATDTRIVLADDDLEMGRAAV